MEFVWDMLGICMLSCILCCLEEIKKEIRKNREIMYTIELDRKSADEEGRDR